MLIFLDILTIILFSLIVTDIVRRKAWGELVFVVSVVIIGTAGEILNLLDSHTTAYTGTSGIPIYIISGGTSLAWGYLKFPLLLAERFKRNTLLLQLFFFFLLTLLFPLIEIIGIKTGLWYWLRPYDIYSPWWLFGVWKYYVTFMGIPVIISLILNTLWKKYLQNAEA